MGRHKGIKGSRPFDLSIWVDRLKDKGLPIKIVEFKGSTGTDNCTFECETHGIFDARLKLIQSSKLLCPECIKDSRPKVKDDFKYISKDFRLPNVNSTKKRWYYTIECEACGAVEEKTLGSKTMNLCTHCSKGGYTVGEFIEKSKERFGDAIDYYKVVYVNNDTKITLHCNTHSLDYEQRPGDHLASKSLGGCPKCAAEVRAKAYQVSENEWSERLPEGFSIISYKELGYHNQVTLLCDKHGEFETTFGAITSTKYLCSRCYKEEFKQKQSILTRFIGKDCILYYVHLPKYDRYKLGITVKSLKERLSKIEYTEIWSITLEYTKAIDAEHKLHNLFIDNRTLDTDIGSGSTELYNTNIIPNITKLIGLLEGDL